MKTMLLNKKCVILLMVCWFASGDLDNNSLEVVHIVFRHGEKNPDLQFTYAKDPHKNVTFYPFFEGQLNLIGRQTMYELGHTLRNRYHKFLGEIYSPKMVEAWASPFPRNIYSLQLVMASLFPPSAVERWNEHLNWQPTIYHFVKWHEDKLFRVVIEDEYKKHYWNSCRKNKSMQSMLEKYRRWLKYIEDHTGFSKDCAQGAAYLFTVLTAQQDANLTLPDWSKSIFPRILEELAIIDYQHMIYTKKLQRIAIGNFLYKILSDTQDRIQGNSEKKFHLYAGHDINIFHILSVLGLSHPHIPKYGACLAIEVHKIEEQHIFKFFYKDNKHAKLKLLRNAQGKDHITFEKYRRIVDDIFINDVEEKPENSVANSNQLNFLTLFLSLHLSIIK